MAVRINPVLFEKHIAPGITSFLKAEIPDLSTEYSQANFWATNHFLNSMLRFAWTDQYRQVVGAFLRRASHAFATYDEARNLTLAYLNGNDPHNPRVGRYYDAVAKWETLAIESTMICDLFNWIVSTDKSKAAKAGERAFERGDGSKECRLYAIGNKIKHMADCVRSGECRADDILPLWIDVPCPRKLYHLL